MSQKPNASNQQDNRAKRACTAMIDIRGALYSRLVDYVLSNKQRLKEEAAGEDSYSFMLQQLDEQFLNKLNIIERSIGELQRSEHREGQTLLTTYQTVEVSARREDLPQKIADALAEHGDSDFLDLCVLRADEKQAEVLLVLAREDSSEALAAPARAEKHEQGEQGETGEDLSSGSGGASGGAEN